LFKLTTGQCPHEFVSRMRLDLAKQMLADRYRPISDIALSAGFSSQSNFSRAFRSATGMTPSDYRRHLAVFEYLSAVREQRALSFGDNLRSIEPRCPGPFPQGECHVRSAGPSR
jgi:AraC-like DNA-binding protein